MKKIQKLNGRQLLRREMEYSKNLISNEVYGVKEKPQEEIEGKGVREWGLHSCMKKIEVKSDILTTPSLRASDSNFSKAMKNWDYVLHKNKVSAQMMPSNMYYPPNCSGYDMTYSKAQNSIYIYGGIPCSSSLIDGIKPYFYKYSEGRWCEVKPESTYNPTPRYGHTLTAYQKELILFGGVSEYKEKLKDRCFYTDCSAYSTVKNNWRMVETSGMSVKSRKNHSASVYSKYYVVYGGLDESQEIINELGWINLDCKKSRWKYFPLQGRFNHKMVAVQPPNGKDFIAIFGGRNSASEIVHNMYFIPLSVYDGDLVIKDVVEVQHTILPREVPMMVGFLEGFLILGGIDKDNEVAEDCWYCTNDKELTKIALSITFSDLRGAKACSLSEQTIYIMAGNSINYKAIKLLPEK